jgi:membrane-bound lytic murein transglycosylase MltF
VLGVGVVLLTIACREQAPTPPPVDAAPADLAGAKSVAEIDDPWLRPIDVARWTGDLDEMMERGFVRLLSPTSRTHFFVDGARERGIAAEAANALESMINARRPRAHPVRVVVVPVQREQLLPMLTAGFGDVAMGNLTVTPERKKQVDFAPPFVSDVRELIVTAPGVEPVATRLDLAGREIWVRRSSSYHTSLQALNSELVTQGLPKVDVRYADENLEDEEILEMVQAGLYPATVVDSHKLEWVWAKVFDAVQVSDVAIREKGTIAAAMRKDSPQLAALLAEFCASYRVGTSFGNQLVSRYFRKSRWIGAATSTSERKKLDAVESTFHEYAERYGFDPLMMIAQGYQESGLEPGARSASGAVGIMQLLPTTSAAPPVSIANVDAPENNIHAGIKYMRHLVDVYFDDPELDEVNRHLFALAAYNAGPSRVSRLRKLAPEYGLDPNKWFKNVEHVVARKVGREPVRYVGNIYKYYLAYRRLRDLEQAGNGEGALRAHVPRLSFRAPRSRAQPRSDSEPEP